MSRLRPLADVVRGSDGAFGQAVAHSASEAARGPVDLALFEPDPLRFAAALLGAWRAGRRVWLAPDRQPATLAALRAAGVALWEPGEAGIDGAGPAPASPMADAALDPQRECLVLFTSGSTGAPEPIGKSLRQLDAEIVALEAVFGPRMGGARVLGSVSHQHIYGLLFRVLWPLACGRDFAAPRLEFPSQWPALAGAGEVLVTTPSVLAQWPEAAARPAPRRVFSSGGPLPPEVAERAARHFGAPVLEVFGSTETGGIAWREASPGAAWQALPGVEWRIEDGRLWLRSPHLPDPAVWRDTADRAAPGPEGGFRLLGRADRIAKIGEKRVSLDGLERQLLGTGLLAEARALLVPGLKRALAVVAVPDAAGRALWQAGGRRRLAAELRHRLLAEREPAQVPRHWRFVAALPRNAQGKVTEAALAALFRPGEPERLARSLEGNVACLSLRVPEDLRFFDGHFDAAPVVPGVVLLDWAIASAAEAFGHAPALGGLEVLKFQQLVTPGAILQLRLEAGPVPGLVTFRYESALGSHASGRLRFAVGGGA